MRPLLLLLFARMFGNSENCPYDLAASMEMLHAATLLHDDILDNATTRRGSPAAHTLHGKNAAILAGDALLAAGNAIVAAYALPSLVDCFSKATLVTASGEIQEMTALGNPELDHQSYLEIARGKTACLIAQSCRMGALFAGAPEALARQAEAFGENIGLAFQITDDALDFSPQSQTGKPAGGDLREGKLTRPLRLYRQSLPEDRRQNFDQHFRTNSFSAGELEQIVREVGAFVPQTLELARAYLDLARQNLLEFPQGREKKLLTSMVDYICERSN